VICVARTFREQLGVVVHPAVLRIDAGDGMAVRNTAGEQQRAVRLAAPGTAGQAE
jgi:hypothetical protein